mmetsp:Transcript_1272/g.3086  ORF Transcript_1272/g.3086 Transcript_1272/m.3086 type:complete len:213 (-) Transcript_1272:468-1106(-)
MMSAIAYNLSYYNIQHHLSTQEKKACVLFFVVASVRGCFGAIRGAARKRSFASLPRRPSQQERTRPTDGGSSRRSSSSVIYLPRGRISATTTRRDRSKEEIHRRGVVRPRRRRPYAVHLRRDRRVFFPAAFVVGDVPGHEEPPHDVPLRARIRAAAAPARIRDGRGSRRRDRPTDGRARLGPEEHRRRSSRVVVVVVRLVAEDPLDDAPLAG